MKTFYKLLGVSLVVATTNNFVWFALTFWIYLTTKSVISTSTLAGIWLVFMATSGIWFGSIVDHNRKKTAMLWSSFVTLALLITAWLIYYFTLGELFTFVGSPVLWVFALVLMIGVVTGSIYHISIPTLVAILVPDKMRSRANGMFGTAMGVSFAITSVASGLALFHLGISGVLVIAILSTIFAISFLSFVKVDEKQIASGASDLGSDIPPISAPQALQEGGQASKIDIKGTISVIKKVPGLFPLIFFTTFNNFLGGVFMALMDAYGLSLVSVQTWGIMWGFLSLGFIFGGLYISKYGLGKSPLKTLFTINIILWIDCIIFAIQPSIYLLAIGMLVWMIFVPFIEATEQTVFQKVVPQERLGRVFGFAHSVEQAASPITAFFIGPIAQIFFIPFMTTGAGVGLIGDWFGVGVGRGIALVFIFAGIIGLMVTLLARRSRAFLLLSQRYSRAK